VSSRTARATQRNPVLKNQNREREREREVGERRKANLLGLEVHVSPVGRL
jgi:hypothetical protein